jgi:hypothetical protein
MRHMPTRPTPRSPGVGWWGRAAILAAPLLACAAPNPAFRDQDAEVDSRADRAVDARADSAVDSYADPAIDSHTDPVYPDRQVQLQDPSSPGQYGGQSGVMHVDACPGNDVLIGYDGSYQSNGPVLIYSLTGRCGKLNVLGGPAYQVIVTPTAILPGRGSAGATTFSARCPQDQVIVGIAGRAGSSLNAIGFQCAPLAIVAVGTEFQLQVVASRTDLPTEGGTGGMAFAASCDPGKVADGHTINAGNWLDGYGLLCARPTLTGP